MTNIYRCRSCGAAILFVKTEKGKTHPLNAAPSPEGEWTLDPGGVMHRAPADADKGRRYTSHFATCPNANQFRSKRKA